GAGDLLPLAAIAAKRTEIMVFSADALGAGVEADAGNASFVGERDDDRVYFSHQGNAHVTAEGLFDGGGVADGRPEHKVIAADARKFPDIEKADPSIGEHG